MRALWNAYFSYAANPVATLHVLVRKRYFSAAFSGYAVAALSWVCFFWLGTDLTVWGFLWRFIFFWLLEISLGYLWAALSGLFLNFFYPGNGPSALFIALGMSGFVQSLLLCFALLVAAAPWMGPLTGLVFVLTLVLRFIFALVSVARAVQIGLSRALGTLCFVLVPVLAAVCLAAGAVVLLVSLAL